MSHTSRRLSLGVLLRLTCPSRPLLSRSYDPVEYYNKNPELKQALDMISEGYFSPDAKDRYARVHDEGKAPEGGVKITIFLVCPSP